MSLQLSERIQKKLLDSLGTDDTEEIIIALLMNDKVKIKMLDFMGKEFILNYLLGNKNERKKSKNDS